MRAPVIRISIGKFDADTTAIVEEKLQASKARLESGIRAMRGNLAQQFSFWNCVIFSAEGLCG